MGWVRADDYEAIRQGPDVWNQYRTSRTTFDPSWVADLTYANLFRANLTEANLFRANLFCANLTEANLPRANLAVANLAGADLHFANLAGAYLAGATLAGADLRGANLTDAYLAGANLFRADLTGADLNRATLAFTVLADVDLSAFCSAEGLTHLGPSSIDSRTVMRSVGHPQLKEFMAACGVPWIFAGYMVDCAKAETADDIGALMQSTFISYGQPDDGFARQLYESLTSRRITVFYFPETARWGERLSNEVHTQLNSHDRVILLCSKGSLNRPGVRNEIQETFDREAREGGASRLLPIALDDYLFDPNGLQSVDPDLAISIRARIVADFRKATTDPTEYDKALNRLIDALKKNKP